MGMIINAETRGLTQRKLWCRILGDEENDSNNNFRFDVKQQCLCRSSLLFDILPIL